MQLNLVFSTRPVHRGVLFGRASHRASGNSSTSRACAALEILARLIARMLVAAANEASHE